MFTFTDTPTSPQKNIQPITIYQGNIKAELYEYPDEASFFISILGSVPENPFSKYKTPVLTDEQYQKTKNFIEQGDFVALANELFQGSTPLVGEEYDILTNTWLKSLKSTSTIEGML